MSEVTVITDGPTVVSIHTIQQRKVRKPRDTPTPLHDLEFLALHMAIHIVTEGKAARREVHDLIRVMAPDLVVQYEVRRGETYTPDIAGNRIHKATYIHRQRFSNPDVNGVHAEVGRYLNILYKAIKEVEKYATDTLSYE